MRNACRVSFRWPSTRKRWPFGIPATNQRAPRLVTLRELAAIAIIKNVPQAFGRELFHSVRNPATIGVKRTILAARGG
jgi:hypothetical protein